MGLPIKTRLVFLHFLEIEKQVYISSQVQCSAILCCRLLALFTYTHCFGASKDVELWKKNCSSRVQTDDSEELNFIVSNL